MKKIAGLFVGSGASRKICLGFVPDAVVIRNITAADLGVINWSRLMAGQTTAPEGVLVEESSGLAAAALTAGAGIRPYYGGELVSAAAATIITAVDELADYRGDLRDAGTLGLVDAFTLDTLANRTGHFNKGVNTSKVGAGSRVLIKSNDGTEEWYTIQSLSNDGDAADEVTFDRAPGSGEVKKILFPYDFYNAEAGSLTKAGIILAETDVVNVAAELCYIEAICYSE